VALVAVSAVPQKARDGTGDWIVHLVLPRNDEGYGMAVTIADDVRLVARTRQDVSKVSPEDRVTLKDGIIDSIQSEGGREEKGFPIRRYAIFVRDASVQIDE
jgi:hypothetical protein